MPWVLMFSANTPGSRGMGQRARMVSMLSWASRLICRCQSPAWASPTMPWRSRSRIWGTGVLGVPFSRLILTDMTFAIGCSPLWFWDGMKDGADISVGVGVVPPNYRRKNFVAFVGADSIRPVVSPLGKQRRRKAPTMHHQTFTNEIRWHNVGTWYVGNIATPPGQYGSAQKLVTLAGG